MKKYKGNKRPVSYTHLDVYKRQEKKMCILPIIDTVGTGIRIMNLRKQSGLSVKELQNILGFATPNAIYKWQNGAAMPTLDNLIVLAAIFNVPIDDIIVTDNKLNISIGA